MKKRVTQREVARAAGVSNAAVSLALRGSASLPAPTRKRIAAVAKKLGYVPDPMLSGLAAYRMSRRPAAYHSNIAWINFWPEPQSGNGAFREYYLGALDRAKEIGFNLEEIDMKTIDYKEKRLQKILVAKGITGLLLPPYPRFGGELNLDFSRFSAVRFGYSYRSPILHTVANAQFQTALEAFQCVAARGYRRIGILLDKDEDERTSWNFLGGIVVGQRLHPELEAIEPFYPRGDYPSKLSLWEMPGLAQKLTDWIRRFRIDGVIGIGHEQTIVKTGLAVGYADFSTDYPNLSGMNQNGFLIGSASIDLLVAMMNRGETGLPATPKEVTVRSVWREGKTLPRRN